jgi:type III restriction enzyme
MVFEQIPDPDAEVLPSPQGAGSPVYEPDFVVETNRQMLICEVKARNELADPIVAVKGTAARKWCKTANVHAVESGGKKWSYVLIPDDQVIGNSTLAGLVAKFGQGAS